MNSNVVNFPIIPRATAFPPEDESDPYTRALRMIKEGVQYGRQHCGHNWTDNVLRAQLAFDNSNNWRERAAVWKKDQK